MLQTIQQAKNHHLRIAYIPQVVGSGTPQISVVIATTLEPIESGVSQLWVGHWLPIPGQTLDSGAASRETHLLKDYKIKLHIVIIALTVKRVQPLPSVLTITLHKPELCNKGEALTAPQSMPNHH
jgi:hypothetical protein